MIFFQLVQAVTMVTIVNKCVAVRMEQRAASTMAAVTVQQDIRVLRVLRVGIHLILGKVLTPTHFLNLILSIGSKYVNNKHYTKSNNKSAHFLYLESQFLQNIARISFWLK